MKKYLNLILFIFSFLFFALAFCILCDSALQYSEHWRTFYYDWHYIGERCTGADAFLSLVTDFFTQFFHNKLLGIAIVSALLAALASLCHKLLARFINRWLAALIGFSVAAVLFATNNSFNTDSNTFKRLCCMAGEEDWIGILAELDGKPVTNRLYQNLYNMALAETGQLGERFLDNYCPDFHSIVIQEYTSPAVAAVASDVYFSMGHMGFAQRYAFEVNEKHNNLAPRMLKRLVKTNIAYGHYAVAEKYLRWLEKTLFYRDWAAKYRAMLYDDEAVMADAEMREKRLAIFPDNRFSGIRGLDDDLLNIVQANPANTTARDYLAALYILAGRDYAEKYKALIETSFTEKDKLPKYFKKYYAK